MEVNDSPVKGDHLYCPHYYKDVLNPNNYSPGDTHNISAQAEEGMHRHVTTALLNRPGMIEPSPVLEAQVNAAKTSAGVYDLAELRRKLVERMEYSKV